MKMTMNDTKIMNFFSFVFFRPAESTLIPNSLSHKPATLSKHVLTSLPYINKLFT